MRKCTAVIPAVIHRLWLGSEIPSEFEENWQHWRDTFRGYKFRTWRERDLESLELPGYFRSVATYAEQADIARLRILQTHGGIYTDCDVEPLDRFDYLWTPADRLVVFEEVAGQRANPRSAAVWNGLIVSAPTALGFIEQFVERNARRGLDVNTPPIRTGPSPFTAALLYLRAMDPDGIRIYPPSFLDLRGDARAAVVRTRFQEQSSVWWRPVPGPRAPLVATPLKDRIFDLRLLPLRIRRLVARRLHRP